MGERSILHGVSIKTTAVFVATERKPTRDYHCPKCDRYLMTSTSTEGKSKVPCYSCKAWHWFELGKDGRPSRK